MKKVICLLMVALLLWCTTPSVLATVTNNLFEDVSLEELFALRDQIELKIQDHLNLDGEIEIPSGVYNVGQDISEGAYLLRLVRILRGHPRLEIRDLKGKLVSYDWFQTANQRLRINLVQDTVLHIDSDGVFTIKKADPLF